MMKKTLILGVIFLITVSGMAFGGEPKERRPPKAVLRQVEMEATVDAVDYEKREVLLRGPAGDLVTVEAGDDVKRLNEVSVGDTVKTGFYTYLQAEFREPTADEKAAPVVILAASGKTIKDLPPGAVVGALIRAVVSVEIIDRPDKIVTVKGPEGNYVSIPVEDEKLLDELKTGEVVVLTYAESIALTLEKQGGAPSDKK